MTACSRISDIFSSLSTPDLPLERPHCVLLATFPEVKGCSCSIININDSMQQNQLISSPPFRPPDLPLERPHCVLLPTFPEVKGWFALTPCYFFSCLGTSRTTG
ncbi:hypothetical protein CEXT_727291 [Caerostris extrusa]|uniref:Uncharacterized protein n=1 Tax=Caerostris extrusa TaxID=172846 RepID=A0AAV4X7P3_CAEEX|nr:hypothetical protein CEXT_727291 [Caerostris extrusa]